MRIIVFGAGAIGSYFGARLEEAGHSVTLVGRTPHVNAVNNNGLKISEPSGKSLRRSRRFT